MATDGLEYQFNKKEMILTALAAEEVESSVFPEITSLVSVIGDIGSIGVAALAIILILYACKKNVIARVDTKKSSNKKTCEIVEVEKPSKEMLELKPILLSLTQSIEKISGNDLSHIHENILDVGRSVNRVELKVDEIEDKLEIHDKQALVIKSKIESTERNIEEIRKYLSRV